MDPFVEYVMIGDSIEDGILAWISLGIDPSVDDSIGSAGTYYKDGGVANPKSGMGGPPPGNGTFPPGGSPPNGTTAA